MIHMPRVLVTGFGPFPDAPQNPTEGLMRVLAAEPPEKFGAGTLKAVVLKTDYRRSWSALRRLYSSFAPNVVLHFGLSSRIDVIHLERAGRNLVDRAKPDAAGYAPSSSLLSKTGPEVIASTLPTAEIVAALKQAGFPAALSDDAGDYVCNATLYRSLRASLGARNIGFVHVPPERKLPAKRLAEAATLVLRFSVGIFSAAHRQAKVL
jgi:pyroglutamyl-peptidase